MQIGTLILQRDPWAVGRTHWRRAEELGVHTAYAADHLTHRTAVDRWWADGWVTLAAAAAETSTMRLGTLVASAAVRAPLALARAAATLQDVSGGRFVLGVGAGAPDDVLADRGEAADVTALGPRFRDVVRGVRAVFDGERERAGEVLSFRGVQTLPHAPGAEPPPLVVAAHGRLGTDLAALVADGWTTYGRPGADREAFWAGVRDQNAAVDDACERAGRDPASLTRSVLVGFAGYRPLESVASFLDDVGAAAAAGFDELVFYWPVDGAVSDFSGEPAVVEEAVLRATGR
jgi:alkanesulfonate monooxygenase SsuD/methylene tetrahydromethanopterin reductase-like flavin-dependent oxidoreductase (luciferase family)